jgi:acyl-CoA synthetase (AMP-forming)/AMP-acid ligase II
MFTVFGSFAAIAAGVDNRPFICVPPSRGRAYLPEGAEFAYGEMLHRALALQAAYRAAGYGHGHRVAMLLENRPDFLLHLLALNGLGVGIVPLNPDLRPAEMRYIFEHCEPDAAVTLTHRMDDLGAVTTGLAKQTPVFDAERLDDRVPAPALPPPRSDLPGAESEAAILYTSGTTGRPKGCIITNRYMVTTGQWYASAGGVIDFSHGNARLYTPMPLFHMAGLCLNSMGMLMSANCLILPDRFHPKTLWQDVIETRATALHYLGVVPAMLLAQPESELERRHGIRFGLGGGASPALRQRFEQRFGFPLAEGWGMTETGRSTFDAFEPRRLDRYAIGAPRNGFEARIVDDNDNELPRGTPGELVVRYAGPDPRFGFFAGYLKDPEATEAAWRGGWFHTGDVATQDADGMLYFVDRKKHVVRRAGENIAAAEVELILASHPAVKQVAILPAPDELRQEEVLACVELRGGHAADATQARALFDWCNERLAYYKAPGWILFFDALPLTATHKVAKTQIFAAGEDPRTRPGIFDFRAAKKRDGQR